MSAEELVVELGPRGREAAQELRQVRYQLRGLREQESALKAELMEELAGADAGMIAGRPVVKVSTAVQRRLDRRKPAYAELVEACSTNATYASVRLL